MNIKFILVITFFTLVTNLQVFYAMSPTATSATTTSASVTTTSASTTTTSANAGGSSNPGIDYASRSPYDLFSQATKHLTQDLTTALHCASQEEGFAFIQKLYDPFHVHNGAEPYKDMLKLFIELQKMKTKDEIVIALEKLYDKSKPYEYEAFIQVFKKELPKLYLNYSNVRSM